MKKLLLLFVLLSFSVLIPRKVNATHFYGADLTYQKVVNAQSLYKFRLTIYSEPSTLLASNKTIKVLNSTTQITATLVSTDTNYIDCATPIITAVFEGYGSFYYVHPGGFTVYWADCCKSSNVENVIGAGASDMYVAVRMSSNSIVTDFGQTPTFTSIPTLLIDAGQTNTLNFAADHPNQDSVYYSLISVRNYVSGTGAVNSIYDTGYTALTPFGDSVSVALNEKTGILKVDNPNVGKYIVAVRADAYNNGQITSRIMREVIVTVMQPLLSKRYPELIATNPQVQFGTYNLVNGNHEFEIFENGSLSIDLQAKIDSSIGTSPVSMRIFASGQLIDSIQNGGPCTGLACATLTNAAGLLSATDSVSGTLTFAPQFGHINGNRDAAFSNILLESSYVDACGVIQSTYQSVYIRVKPSTISASSDTIYRCYRDTLSPQLLGDTNNIVWSPNYGISDINSAKPKLYPDSSTTYIITNLNDGSQIFLHVETSIQSIAITQIGNLLDLPDELSGEWFYNGFSFGYGKAMKAMSGTFWAKIITPNCQVWSDTFVVSSPFIGSTGQYPVDSIEYLNYVNRMWVYFTGTGGSNVLQTIDLRWHSAISNNNDGAWKYTIMNNVAGTPVVKSGSININLSIIQNLFLPVDTSTRYILYMYNSNFGHYSLNFYRHNTLPYTDDKNLIRIESGSVYNGSLHLNLVSPLLFNMYNSNLDVEENMYAHIKVYPNPFTDLIIVKGEIAGLFELFDMSGKLLLKKTINGEAEINVAFLPNGLYYYTISGKEGTASGKLMK